MSTKKNLIGQTFGRLTVVSEAPSDRFNRTRWHCVCSCGGKKIVSGYCLTAGTTKSCGCLRHIAYHKTHGESGSILFSVWQGMKSRCYCAGRKDFKHYGARGIAVCDAWKHDFPAFRSWALSSGYSDGLSIDRIDVNGDYCPDNCRWVTQTDQVRNRRNSIRYKGLSLKEWSAITGINYYTLHDRITKCGWPFEKAIRTPSRSKHYA